MSFDASQIVFFFGAGASAPFGIPTMKQFVVDFEEYLKNKGDSHEKEIYNRIKESLGDQLKEDMDLEAVFTVIEGLIDWRIDNIGYLSLYLVHRYLKAELSSFFKNIYSGYKNVTCEGLKQKFQKFVKDKCVIREEKIFGTVSQVYRDFFNRICAESDYKDDGFHSKSGHSYYDSWTIFTTNYDTCLEHYWRATAEINLNTGSRAREETRTWVLDPRLFFNDNLRLFKLHGSVSWFLDSDGVITEEQQTAGTPLLGKKKIVGEMMLYPIQQKELYLEPYVSMLKELNSQLKTKTIWIVVGYSFNDSVIREIFLRNSDVTKRIVLIHPHAQEVIEKRLSSIRRSSIFPLNQRFGRNDFTSVNRELVKHLKQDRSAG